MIELLLGTLYGLLIGIIPSAGATTGLVVLFLVLCTCFLMNTQRLFL